MAGSPTPIVITNAQGQALTITGATSSSGTPQAPTPCVLTDTNGNPLVLGSGSIEALTPSGNGTYAATGQVGLTTAPNGDIITADGSGNVKDSGTLLSSLAPLANPALTGTASAVTLKVSKSVTTGINALGNQSGSITIDLSLGNVISLTLTGNTTISSFTNGVASVGEEITLIVSQNGTGGYTLTWPSAVAGKIPAISPVASSVSVFKGVFDGTNLNFSNNGPTAVAYKILTGQNAASGAYATVYTTLTAGFYRINGSIYATTVSSTSWNVELAAQLTNNGGAVASSWEVAACNLDTLAGGQPISSPLAYLPAGATIQIGTFTLTGSNTSGVFSYAVCIEQV